MPTRFDTILTDALIKKHTSTGAWENKTLLDHLEHWTAERPEFGRLPRSLWKPHLWQLSADNRDVCPGPSSTSGATR